MASNAEGVTLMGSALALGPAACYIQRGDCAGDTFTASGMQSVDLSIHQLI